jgi:hypothetical protein
MAILGLLAAGVLLILLAALAWRRTSATRRSTVQEPPAGFEPAPRPYDGRVLAADTTEAEREWRCRESNPILIGASEALSRMSFIPGLMRTSGVEPPQRGAAALQADELANAQHPRVRVAGRT